MWCLNEARPESVYFLLANSITFYYEGRQDVENARDAL